MEGKQVIILDDVISTGSTLQGMRLLMQHANANVVAEAAIFTKANAPNGAMSFLLGICPFLPTETRFRKGSPPTLRFDDPAGSSRVFFSSLKQVRLSLTGAGAFEFERGNKFRKRFAFLLQNSQSIFLVGRSPRFTDEPLRLSSYLLFF